MALIIDIKVVPNSGKLQYVLDKSGILKCYLKSQPEGGKANAELIKFLAKELGMPQDKVSIISGLSSRNKRVKIDRALTFQALLDELGIEIQKKIF
jgi:uncharacterized protein